MIVYVCCEQYASTLGAQLHHFPGELAKLVRLIPYEHLYRLDVLPQPHTSSLISTGSTPNNSDVPAAYGNGSMSAAASCRASTIPGRCSSAFLSFASCMPKD